MALDLTRDLFVLDEILHPHATDPSPLSPREPWCEGIIAYERTSHPFNVENSPHVGFRPILKGTTPICQM
jgi:hypothetical protein